MVINKDVLKTTEQELIDSLRRRTSVDLEAIKTRTVGQNANPELQLERSKLIAASNFGRICRLRQSTRRRSIVESLMNPRKLSNPYVNTWTSANAVIQGEDAIIEVKYPDTDSQLTPQAAILAKKIKFATYKMSVLN
ncbi:hypothetical protein ILUMI_17056 [Ignelater luminosus]|uniref:Uncharacterized protein n=1 Tax=Ignelater luminosus TaxID=2038154 RepID=A0A8K0CRQ9_IGNLU|nr:hypothetical protein ILUMI_17056 [Ignelater luminosus]